MLRSTLSLTLGCAALLTACGSAAPASPSPSTAAPASTAAKPAASSAASASAKPAASAAASASAKPAASGGSSAAASLGPANPNVVVMSYSEVVGVHATEWGAKEAGIFEKNGLNVDVRLIESSLGVPSLLSGQVQIASMGGSEAMAANVQGADLVAYATMSPVYPYKFEAQASVKTPADLKGKKVGISRFGSSSDTATRAWFKKIGLDPDKDVTLVQIGSLQARTEALKQGALDGAMASTTDAPVLEAAGLHPLADLAAEKLPAVNDCVIATRAWATANKDKLQKFIDSTMEAKPKLKADKNFAFDVFRKYLKITDTAQLQGNYDYYIGEVIPDAPLPAIDGFKDALSALAVQNPKAASYDVTKMVDPSFVQSAVDRGVGKS
jgi:NitT/TauT family transport system substrate-binding protein